MSTRRRRGLGTLLLAAPILLCCTGVAYAHVTVQPTTATAGSETTLTFRVPTEKDNTDTVKLMVALPTDPPIPSVSLQPVPGWRAEVATRKLDRPVQTDDGPVTTTIARVTWTAVDRADAIGPGQFQTFTISAGPLPSGRLIFKALQYYSDGSVVRWIDPPIKGGEPAHPAPVVRVVADARPPPRGAGGSSNSDNWIAVAAFVAGLLGFAAGGAALVVAARRPTTGGRS